MKIQSFLVATIIAISFTGCAGTSLTRIIGNTVGAAGGAFLGNTLGDGDSVATAAGAGAGLLLSESLQAGSTAANEKSYVEGYEKGRSDSAKQKYQTFIEQQRQSSNGAGDPAKLFEIPLPEREVGGAILEPSTRTLRIQE